MRSDIVRGLFTGFACAAVIASSQPALAQSVSHKVPILVLDAETGRPVSSALVEIDGKRAAVTDVAGRAAVSVPSSAVALVVRATGYVESRRPPSVLRALVEIRLSPLGQIGRTRAVQPASGATTTTNDRTLTDVLSSIATVDVAPLSAQVNAAPVISIAGRDESQTAIKVLGVKVGGGVSAPVLRAIPPELLTSVTVDFNANPVSPAGTVEFRSTDPAKPFTLVTKAAFGSLERLKYSAVGTGGIGTVNLSYGHAWRGGNAPLSGLSFVDQGNTQFDHVAVVHQYSDFVRGAVRFSPVTTFSFGALLSNSRTSAVCSEFVAALPCSDGLGSREEERFQLGTVSFATAAAHSDVSLTASAWRNKDSGYGTTIAGASENTAEEIGQRSVQLLVSRKLGLHAFAAAWELSEVNQLANAVSVYSASNVRGFERVSDVSLEDVFGVRARLNATARVHHVALTGLSPSLTAEFGMTWKPTSRWNHSATAYVGSASPSYNLQRPLSDPTFVSIACDGATLVRGPGDTDQEQRILGVRTSVTTSTPGRVVGVIASYERQGGQTLNLSIPLLNEPAGYLAPDYLSLLEARWHQPGRCGSRPFAASQFYVIQPVAGTVRDYLSLSATAKLALGRQVSVNASVAYNSARLVRSADPRLSGPHSQFFEGEQLVGRPPLRGTLNVLGSSANNGSDILLSAQYTDANNLRRLGSFTTVGIALSKTVGRGRITFAATNLLNADTGRFATLLNSYATPLRVGAPIARPVQPLEPRQIMLSYALHAVSAAAAGKR